MSVPSLLVRLYPAPVRRRWGEDLHQQIIQTGPPGWLDAISGAAGLWLHPALWPQGEPGERRRVMAVFAVAVTAGTALIMRATGASTGNPHRGFGASWLLLVICGMLAAAPVPRLNPVLLVRLLCVAAQTLAAPVVAGIALIVLANSHLIDHVTGVWHLVLLASYWLTLAIAGWCACLLVGRTAGLVTPPGDRRIRVALVLIGTGLALAAAQIILTSWHGPIDVNQIVAASALITLTAAVVVTGRDMHTTIAGGTRW